MISLRPYRTKDVVLIAVSSVVLSAISSMSARYLSASFAYLITIIAAMILCVHAVRLVRKFGSVTLLLGLSSLITYNLGEFGVTGGEKLITLLLAGVLFEGVVFLVGTFNTLAGVLSASFVSAASMPLLGASLVSFQLVKENLLTIFNSMLIYGIVGIFGAFLGHIIWIHVRTTKFALRFMESLKE